MPYAMHEIELDSPPGPVHVPAGDTGFALVVRRAGRPVGFVMRECVGPREIGAPEIAAIAQAGIGEAALREPLSRPVQATFGDGLPSLTIAVCTKDRTDDLAACVTRLREVRASEPGGGAGVEILVVDNAPSDDRTRALVDGLGDVRYVRDPMPGLDFARNRAIATASGEFLAFVDDDVTVDRGWLQGLKQALIEHPDAGAVTGLVLPAELRTEAQILFERRGGFQKHFATKRFGRELPGHPFYPCLGGQYGTGCNMAWRRSVLLDLGGFDEALDAGAALPGGGDTDMFYRAVRAGHPLVYEPRFLVFHRHRTELDQLRRQYAWSWGLGLMAYVSKTWRSDVPHRPQLRRLVTWWFANELRELARSAAGRHVLPPSMLAGELWGGIVGLCGAYDRSQSRARRIRLEHGAAGGDTDAPTARAA